MKRPLVSVSWWDWGGSGPQRRWEFPRRKKRVSAQLTVGSITLGAGRSYHDGAKYLSVTTRKRHLIRWRSDQ